MVHIIYKMLVSLYDLSTLCRVSLFSGAANSGIWPNCALSVKSVKLGTNIL